MPSAPGPPAWKPTSRSTSTCPSYPPTITIALGILHHFHTENLDMYAEDTTAEVFFYVAMGMVARNHCCHDEEEVRRYEIHDFDQTDRRWGARAWDLMAEPMKKAMMRAWQSQDWGKKLDRTSFVEEGRSFATKAEELGKSSEEWRRMTYFKRITDEMQKEEEERLAVLAVERAAREARREAEEQYERETVAGIVLDNLFEGKGNGEEVEEVWSPRTDLGDVEMPVPTVYATGPAALKDEFVKPEFESVSGAWPAPPAQISCDLYCSLDRGDLYPMPNDEPSGLPIHMGRRPIPRRLVDGEFKHISDGKFEKWLHVSNFDFQPHWYFVDFYVEGPYRSTYVRYSVIKTKTPMLRNEEEVTLYKREANTNYGIRLGFWRRAVKVADCAAEKARKAVNVVFRPSGVDAEVGQEEEGIRGREKEEREMGRKWGFDVGFGGVGMKRVL
ncbi:hypothetical protein D9611_007492 [Ephemerocybe angulata]|uniref:Uncharacterized protein n=1 Tax=Ephemerocybe angulata TaxID=980116 RepID=A0A8H5CFY6_9AGAR|nr:hypothetical protein D9611_007492 [Tulosesus angulatus]